MSRQSPVLVTNIFDLSAMSQKEGNIIRMGGEIFDPPSDTWHSTFQLKQNHIEILNPDRWAV